jgi:hypothetical protein
MCAPEKGGSPESWFSRKMVQHKDGSAYLPFYDGEGGIVERTKKSSPYERVEGKAREPKCSETA